jgi:hypothetical protein
MKPGIWIAPLAALLAAGCGYHTGGRGLLLPKNITTIAVPAFKNITTRYRLAELLPAAITRELIARTHYDVVTDPNTADAVLTGTVTHFFGAPVIFNQSTGRATTVQVYVRFDIALHERATGKDLYSRNGVEFRERYEISVDPAAYFEESEVAMDRLSKDVARTIVSGILEKF